MTVYNQDGIQKNHSTTHATERSHFGGDSGIPVPGKPELFPKSGEVGERTKDPWPAAVGDSGMPERDDGKAGREGDDISVFIPACMYTQRLTRP